MKPFHLMALCLSVPVVFAAPAPEGKISFINRDQLNGVVKAIEKDLVVWESPLLEKPAPFLLNKVIEMNLSPASSESGEGYEAAVTLTNGDVLRGQLTSVTDQSIELDTWYAGHITLNRPVVESVKIEERPKLFFNGPESLEGWTLTGSKANAWSFEAGSFVSNAPGSIARNLELPDQFRIAFNMEWRSSLRLRLICCSDKIETETPGNSYELSMQRRFAYLRKKSSQGLSVLGQSQSIAEFIENEKARIELCVDRKKGVFNLIVDGRSAVVWNDNDVREGAMTGGGIHFVAEDSYPVRISRIQVSAWDGVIAQMPEAEDPNVAEEEGLKEEKAKEAEIGRMVLRNGDTIAGEVLEIRNGIMKVKTRFDEIKLPVSRLRTISLKPVEREVPKLRNGDIRAWFPDGSRVVFRLDSSTPGTVTGSSQNFGTATFKISAFNRIEFNLYDPAFQEMRGEKGW